MQRRNFLNLVRLTSLWQSLRASLWPMPIAFILAALGMGLALPRLDASLRDDVDAWYLYAGEPDSAREVLATIASSLMSLSGFVFSITILALQLASSQFSPRVLRTFMTDLTTQMAMGTFLGSFVYSMVLLPQVRSGSESFVPALSVFVAIASVLVSVVMFVRYIHHMAHSIRVVHVMRAVTLEAHEAIDKLYPDIGSDQILQEPELPEGAHDQQVSNGPRAGVVAALDQDELLRLACEHDAVIEFTRKVGDFVPRGAPLFVIWCQRELPAELLRECVVLENERTPVQDASFGLRQLVDIAERALSPGINDPTTAVQALDCIHDLLRAVVQRKIPPPTRSDEHGSLRLILPAQTWSGYVHLGLDEIRQYGRNSIQVMLRLRALLDDLSSIADSSRAPVLHEQSRLLDQAIATSYTDAGERALASVPTPR